MSTARSGLFSASAARPRLQQQLELYRQIFANSSDGIAIVDANGYYIEQNTAHCELTGYSDSDLAGKTPAIHLGDQAFADIAAILAQGGRYRGEHVSRTRTGQLKRIELSAFPVTDSDGNLLCYVGIKRDITERHRADEERAARLRELEVLFDLAQAVNRAVRIEEVYECALDALMTSVRVDRASILLYDEDNVMRFKAWRGLSEAYRKAVEGHSPWKPGTRNPEPVTVSDAASDPALASYRDIVVSEHLGALAFIPIVHEERLLGKFMLYFDTPHAFAPSEIRLAEVLAAHIAAAIQRHRGEEALRRNEKLATAGRLAATVAHEINNPLEAVTNLLYLARTEANSDQARSYIELAERELGRVSSIAKQTLAFHRDTGTRTPVALGSLLDEIIAGHRTRIDAAGVAINTSYAPDAVVLGSRAELIQLFANILSNALDALRGDGNRITVIARTEGSDAIVEIADTGSGIAAEHLPRIFDPFFTTKKHVGTGLGLWLSKEIAEKHSGRIEVFTSTAAGDHGTRFVLHFPLYSKN